MSPRGVTDKAFAICSGYALGDRVVRGFPDRVYHRELHAIVRRSYP
jgi:hypothetical protein